MVVRVNRQDADKASPRIATQNDCLCDVSSSSGGASSSSIVLIYLPVTLMLVVLLNLMHCCIIIDMLGCMLLVCFASHESNLL